MEIKTSEQIKTIYYRQPELGKFEDKIKFNTQKWLNLDDLKEFIAKDNFDGALSTHNLLQELGLTELDIDWTIGE